MSSSDDSPYHEGPSPRGKRRRRRGKSAKKSTAAIGSSESRHRRAKTAKAATPAKSAGRASGTSSHKRGRGRGRKRGTGSGQHELTSHPTSRGAYVETRAWLLKEYGPHCAYCGRKFTAKVMTLDHVAPRRGQTAFDRRDNLVLCCPGCNMAKRDKPPLAFLLASKARAAHLIKYGAHLSHGLLELARPIAERHGHGHAHAHADAHSHAHPPKKERHTYGPRHPDEESPYSD